jgi:glycosyltransferase involved in cell wall biosynthesis
MRVCFVISNAYALNAFLAGPIETLAADGCEVTVAFNQSAGGQVAAAIRDNARLVQVNIARDIALLRDVRALWQLWQVLRRGRFDVVHSVTPKAGLLAMLAGIAARVPARLHTFVGQVWVTRKGPMRWLLRSLDRLIARCATQALTDSPSQRDFLVQQHVAPAARLRVLAEGSICGVDGARFRPDPQARVDVREELGISDTAPMLLYLGRMHPDKGMLELGQAFARLAARHKNLHLVLVGPEEGGLALLSPSVAAVADRVHLVGLTAAPERYVAAADLFCLPSYREGFGLSLLEAAAAGVPCVASRIYGITDAVEDEVTGLLVPAHDAAALAQALARMVGDPALRGRMGEAARQRALTRFSRQVLLQAWRELYAEQARPAAKS